uniref:Uncharacterized protein n=1 Tax=Oryza glumipatula TaxID=40148 RepID=A0A0D9ZL45_9ORYZ
MAGAVTTSLEGQSLLSQLSITKLFSEWDSFEAPRTAAQSWARNARNLGVILDAATNPPRCMLTPTIHIINMQLERIQVCNLVMKHQVVRKILKILPHLIVALCSFTCALELPMIYIEARHGAPEVLPPLGQHARLHHLPGLHEGHDDMEEAVRQRAEPIDGDAAFTGPLSCGVQIHGDLESSALGAIPLQSTRVPKILHQPQ